MKNENPRREGIVSRTTKETEISVRIDLDGTGSSSVATGIPFFDHMLELLARHGFFNLEVKAVGDIDVDCHHTMEDIGIVLGEALSKALGDKKGIRRYGWALLPMDESLVMVSLDLSGRSSLYYDLVPPDSRINNIDTRLFREFFNAFCLNAGVNMHIRLLAGEEVHHVFECVFKAFSKALDMAVGFDRRIDGVLSTKGIL